MLKSVKSFSVGYNPINNNDTFTSGDQITGQVTLELSKQCKIVLLWVKLKGKTEVYWNVNEYANVHAKEKFFSTQKFIIGESKGINIVDQGRHVYPFTFQIPAQELPSSFRGSHGKIQYKLEAYVRTSKGSNSKAKAEFTLIHKPNRDPSLMSPQKSAIEKKTTFFSSQKVSIDAKIEQTGFQQGEGIKVVASIHNMTSRNIAPKFCLYRTTFYIVKNAMKFEGMKVVKELGEAIPPSSSQTVTRTITIPPTTCPSISNCNFIRVGYVLRVYVDFKKAQVVLPIVILPEQSAYPASDPPPPPMYPSFTAI